MNKLVVGVWWALAMFAAFWALTLNSPSADASPFNDPHIPSYNNGWCPGGGLGTEGRQGWCDGEPYDDGSFWHQNGYQTVIGFQVSTTCAVRTDNPFVLQKAPAGSCDGEA